MGNNNSWTMQLAQGAAGGALGIGLGAIGGAIQNAQQKALMKQQIKGQKEMSDYNYAKQLQMWHDTNYGAQVKEMEAAGINPALLYGMSGGGGTTTGSGSGGNVTGGQATNPGGMGIQMATAAAQMGLLKAQKENIEADTENKKADIPVKGATVPKIEAETKSITEGIKGIELTNEFLKKSLNDRVDIINSQMGQEIEKLDILHQQKLLDVQTKEFKVEQLRQQAAGAYLQNLLIDATTREKNQSIEQSKQQIEQSKAQIAQWTQQLLQGWEQLGINEKNAKINAIAQSIEQTYKGVKILGVNLPTHDPYRVRNEIDKIMGTHVNK